MNKQRSFLIIVLLTSSLCGCTSFCDSIINCEMAMRNKILAQKAWGHWSWCYDDLDYPLHFARGFKAGYRDVLNGGAGCQPTLPPQCYWKPQFQSPEGRCKTNSWFDGFSHGALAAKQDGYGNLGEIPISPTARANIETARRRPVSTTGQYRPMPGTGLTPIEMPPGSFMDSPAESAGQATVPAGPDELQPVAPGSGDQPVIVRPYE